MDPGNLDADLAEFEAELQQVQASASPESLPVSNSVRAALTAAATSVPPVAGQSASAAPAPPAGKWIWDGNAWNWCTETTAPLPATASATPVRPVAAAAEPGQSVPRTFAVERPLSAAPRKTIKRMAAGDVWEDKTLQEWPENDHRIFVGDLAPDATDAELVEAFRKYPSFNMARVIMDKKAGACRGFGFVSFARGEDMVAALREMNGKYIGTRPVKLKKSNWQKRSLTSERRKDLRAFKAITKHAGR